MSAKVDLTNIFLMVLSAILAVILPFETFLLSYAILGPLHYTTEISWLHKKQYFLWQNKNDYRFLLIFCSAIALAILCIVSWPLLKNFNFIANILVTANVDEKAFSRELSLLYPCLIFMTFAAALIISLSKNWWIRINLLVFAFFISLIFRGIRFYDLTFGLLLTTLIHVWIFTGIFILLGALKNKTISGYASFAVFIFCSLSFFFISKSDYSMSAYAAEIIKGGSLDMNDALFRILNITFEKKDLIYSPTGLKVQGFIAFAYTYHYLNWFSKVEVIKWHQVSKNALVLSLLIWVAAISLYLNDYAVGGYFLLFLSMLHVFLEFPLNLRAMAELVKK